MRKKRKKRKDFLVQPLTEVLSEILKLSKVPDTWKDAYIVLIQEQDTDLLSVKNDTPISLLINDYEIFANILAN